MSRALSMNITPSSAPSSPDFLRGAYSVSDDSLLSIGALGITGNLLVVLVLLNHPTSRKKLANLFIINQSIIDLTASIVLISDTLYRKLNPIESGLSADSISDNIFCRVWVSGLLLWALFMSSAYGIVLLSIERYLAIVHPFVHAVKLTRKRSALAMAAVWSIGFVYNSAYIIPTTAIVGENCVVVGRDRV